MNRKSEKFFAVPLKLFGNSGRWEGALKPVLAVDANEARQYVRESLLVSGGGGSLTAGETGAGIKWRIGTPQRVNEQTFRKLQRRWNPGFFSDEAKAKAKRVQRIRPVAEKGTNLKGHIIGAGPKGWLKVKWENRDKPTLIRRDQLKLSRGLKSLKNPIAIQRCTSCGQVFGQTTECPMCRAGIGMKARNPKSRAQVIRTTKARMKGLGDLNLRSFGKVRETEKQLKAQLKRARTPVVGPKGKLPNPKMVGSDADPVTLKQAREIVKEHKDYLARTWDGTETENRAFHQLVGAYEFAGFDHNRAFAAAQRELNKKRKKKNPRAKGSRDALGVWHVENPVKDLSVRNGTVVLLRSFWGHKAGTRGTVTKGFLKLKGSPRAAVTANDIDVLFRYIDNARKYNPSVTELAEKFQGKADGSVEEFYAAASAPKNLARAGKLVFLKVAGRSLRIPGAMVAIAPNEKLWITGDHAPLFDTKARAGEGLDVGEVTHICYETAKDHIGNGKTFEYVHEFGEEGGKRPHLIIDHEGMPILRSGDYKIRAEGIVD